MHRSQALIALLTCLMSTLFCTASFALPDSSPVPGGLVSIPLGTSQNPAPNATYKGKPIAVIEHNKHWHGLVGINLSTKPGEYKITANGKDYPFQVAGKKYQEQHITLKTRKHIDLSPEDLARHQKEKRKAQAVFAAFDKSQNADLAFIQPAQGPFSSPFGLTRFFNGEPRNPHSGLDIAANTGSPVIAPAAGKVVLTGNFFFNGNVVYVDHGQGLVSMFCHLSKIDVTQGQTLAKAQKLGEVGATGRVTGPHLHWSVSLNNARIDPMLFLKR